MSTPVPCLNPSPRISLTLVSAVAGGPVGLEADIVPSASTQNGVTLNSDGLYVQGPPTVVSSLPTSPFNGMEIYYQADPTDSSIKWHFRYSAGSSKTYKWEFLGGPMLTAEQQSADTLNGQGDSNYHSLNNGPAVAVPEDGVYDIYMSVNANPTSGATGTVIRVGAQYCDTLPGDADGILWTTDTGATPGRQQLTRTLPKRTLCGGQQAKIVYGNNNATAANSVDFNNRVVGILPVRI